MIRNYRRLTIGTIILATLSSAGGVVMAQSASASVKCPRGSVCMWEDSGYRGDLYVVQQQPTRGRSTCYEIDRWDGDNEITSVINNTGRTVRLYNLDTCHRKPWVKPQIYDIPAGQRRPNLKRNGFNDIAESYRIMG